jgi:hypothetical protein
MLAGPGIERNHGAFGFDWSTHVRDPQPADADLTIAIAAGPLQLADRYLSTEALSGGPLDDLLKGDSLVPSDVDAELGGPPGMNVLSAEGIARISGLAALLAPGATKFDAGNIIIGGGGSDRIEGRGADDVIDGDAYLNVRLSVRNDPADPRTETRTADSLAELQPDVFAGTLDPGKIVIVREIKVPAPGGSPSAADTAVFSGPRADYDITPGPNGLTVAHARGSQADGTDTLRNIEQLQFSDQTTAVQGPNAPTIGNATAGNTTATARWTAPANAGPAPISGYDVLVYAGTAPNPVRTVAVAADARQLLVTGLANGTSYTFRVRARNALFGAGPLSAPSNAVTPATVPGAPVIRPPVRGNTLVNVRWTAPVDNGGSPVTAYEVQVFLGRGAAVQKRVSVAGNATSVDVTGLTNGTTYTFRVVASNAVGRGIQSGRSLDAVPATTPSAPTSVTAVRGAAGNPLTATIGWAPPANAGGRPVTGYQVYALPVRADGTYGPALSSSVRLPTTRSYSFTLPRGTYAFQVVAYNEVGRGTRSAPIGRVVPR